MDTTTAPAANDTAPTIRLGCTIRDAAVGISGIACQLMQELGGNKRWVIQPKAKEDNSLPEAIFIDQNIADYVDEGVADRVVPAAPIQHKLGDRLRDKVTGFEGIATTVNTYMNGCVYFLVAAPARKTRLLMRAKSEGEVMNLAQDRWEKVGVAIKVADMDRPKGTKAPGGPMTRGKLYGASR